MLVELSMQYCGQIHWDSFETFKIIFLGGYVLRIGLKKKIKYRRRKKSKNYTVN